MKKFVHIDCTLRDGGYYNKWDFSSEEITKYLTAMVAAGVDVVELGFRSLDVTGYRGPCAYSTDQFIAGLVIPDGLLLAVMVNANELIKHPHGAVDAVKQIFSPREESPVDIVRVACHMYEVEAIIPACELLAALGYKVGLNLMQIAGKSESEVEQVVKRVATCELEVLYFADSLGSLDPDQTAEIVQVLRRHWSGALGIHTHDNMGLALANTLRAMREGVTWVDSTVTGMGRGPGNAQTEYLVLEMQSRADRPVNLIPLLTLIKNYFKPLQVRYQWGNNPYYYLAGKYGVHPTYIQEMLSDTRYDEADTLVVIEHLRKTGASKYNRAMLDKGRNNYSRVAKGSWSPKTIIKGRKVLIIGSGPSVSKHRVALHHYIRTYRPIVLVLNTQSAIDTDLITLRVASHPLRLLADSERYRTFPQPLVVPIASLTAEVRDRLSTVSVYDFGMSVEHKTFKFNDTSVTVPSSLVIAYALGLSSSGLATRILLAGFDGYTAADPRNAEMNELFSLYQATNGSRPLCSITPTKYNIESSSVYAIR